MPSTRHSSRALAGRFALAPVAWVLLTLASSARADDLASQWVARVAQAARQLNYVGTVVYQQGARVETSRLTHLNDNGREYEKLVNLDGPAREVVRSEEHTSELQSLAYLVCRLLLEKKKEDRPVPQHLRRAAPAHQALTRRQ